MHADGRALAPQPADTRRHLEPGPKNPMTTSPLALSRHLGHTALARLLLCLFSFPLFIAVTPRAAETGGVSGSF